MNKIVKLLLLSLCISGFTLAQEHEDRASELLEKVSETLASYANIKVDFTYELVNRSEYIQQKERGSLVVQGDSYFLNLMGIKQICDGKQVHTINAENEEVLIEAVDDAIGEGLNPSSLFSFYKEGYLFSWDIKQPILGGRTIQYIKLTPIDTYAQAAYLLLGIDTKTHHIYKLIEVGENDTETTLTVRSFTPDVDLAANTFVFDQKDYPNYYIDRL
jgi:outer membrane lipoprotein-sorting protein